MSSSRSWRRGGWRATRRSAGGRSGRWWSRRRSAACGRIGAAAAGADDPTSRAGDHVADRCHRGGDRARGDGVAGCGCAISALGRSDLVRGGGAAPELVGRDGGAGGCAGARWASERVLFLGYLPLVLAGVGVWRDRRRAGVWLGLAMIAFALALGPTLQFLDGPVAIWRARGAAAVPPLQEVPGIGPARAPRATGYW